MAVPITDSADSTDCRILGLFAKAWDPGKVKTRLARTLGDNAAANIYRSLLSVNLMCLSNIADKRKVAYSPSDQATLKRFEAFLDSHKPAVLWDFVPQTDGELGTRMSSFFQLQFETHGNDSRVVLVGSDALWLSRTIVDQAFELLGENDVVFGPSTDGGYYLVGLSKMNASMFRDIDWSTEKVLPQSLDRCAAADLKVAQLETLSDIDDEEDLRREVRSLRSMEWIEVDAFRQCFLEDVNDILGKDWP